MKEAPPGCIAIEYQTIETHEDTMMVSPDGGDTVGKWVDGLITDVTGDNQVLGILKLDLTAITKDIVDNCAARSQPTKAKHR